MTQQQQLKLNVEGMNCEHCAATVQKALQSVAGVTAVSVDLNGKNAVVSTDPATAIRPEALIAAVTAKGYKCSTAAS